MAITEQKVWVTSKGTKCNSFEEAQGKEVSELVDQLLHACIDEDAQVDTFAFLEFIQNNPEAKPFVEAINHLYNQNPVSKTDAT